MSNAPDTWRSGSRRAAVAAGHVHDGAGRRRVAWRECAQAPSVRRRDLSGARLVAGAALAALATGCGQSSPTPVQVTAQHFRFSPDTLELAQNGPVRFSLRDPDTTEHDFQVDGLEVMTGAMAAGHVHQAGSVPAGLHVHAEAGSTTTLTFTPETRGTFQVYCTIPGHREAGMVATLTVR